MIEVHDNFLSPDQHRRISDFMLGNGALDWKFNDTKVSTQTKNSIDNYQFTHVFFTFHSCTGKAVHEVSKSIDLLLPLVNKIPFVALHRIKANLEPVKPKRLYSDFHCDVDCSTMTTGIYYINTNDGYTEFETGDKVKSVANRYVKFPSNIKHRGVSQIDTKVRCVLNLNYFELPV
tara:strand:+ start:3817 stop:4344 length:528 start_codon:yes stop_codon:yes gene_type:complete